MACLARSEFDPYFQCFRFQIGLRTEDNVTDRLSTKTGENNLLKFFTLFTYILLLWVGTYLGTYLVPTLLISWVYKRNFF